MNWSTENTLAFITLLITIPTSLIGVWAIIKCWRKHFRRAKYSSRTEVLPMALNATRLHHFLDRPALSPNSLHSSEPGLLPSFHFVRFESLEIRRPIFEPQEQCESF
ncbi:hypothetical protein BDV11DRAFT_190254 [Aspergillus similis]